GDEHGAAAALAGGGAAVLGRGQPAAFTEQLQERGAVVGLDGGGSAVERKLDARHDLELCARPQVACKREPCTGEPKQYRIDRDPSRDPASSAVVPAHLPNRMRRGLLAPSLQGL